MDTQETLASVREAIRVLRAGADLAFAGAETEPVLREENARIVGKQGSLPSLFGQMHTLPPEERKTIGGELNLLKEELSCSFGRRLRQLEEDRHSRELAASKVDLTLPGRRVPPGHKHPLSLVREELVDLFASLGFAVHDGPEVELEVNNFTKLGFPKDHPATDMQDSFWTTSGHVLRTHTSNVQVRAMMAHSPPMAFVAPGAVYRRDDDATHAPMFHQVEGFLVSEQATFAQLKGVLDAFVTRLYGPGTPLRFRPSYFPFVEPGAEVDIGCVFCVQKDGVRLGCNLCKKTGWIEILGCGMIHPVVFEHCGIDPERYTGFAFGMGIERIAMLRYRIPDIRLLFENDPRMLAQFAR